MNPSNQNAEPVLEGMAARVTALLRFAFWICLLACLAAGGALFFLEPFELDWDRQLGQALGLDGGSLAGAAIIAACLFGFGLLTLIRRWLLNPQKAKAISSSIEDLWMLFFMKLTHDPSAPAEIAGRPGALRLLFIPERTSVDLSSVSPTQRAFLLRFFAAKILRWGAGAAFAVFGVGARLLNLPPWLSWTLVSAGLVVVLATRLQPERIRRGLKVLALME